MANKRDFAVGIVATAPSPAASGTSLVLQTNQGLDMPAVPFFATATPPGQLTSKANSEKVSVTDVTGDTLTIVRAQGETTAQSIAAGWIISNGVYTDDVVDPSLVVPYTGATGDVDLGANGITATGVTSKSDVNMYTGSGVAYFSDNGTTPLGSTSFSSDGVMSIGSNGYGTASHDYTNLTVAQTYTYPDKTGTVALLDDTNEPKLTNDRTITKGPTGFTSPVDVIVTYDASSQKITLTGTVMAYYRGVSVATTDPTFVSGWESAAHTDSVGVYFLYFDGTNFVWGTSFPDFSVLQIAVVNYRATNSFGNRECHGFMPWESHKIDHYNIGTYRTLGGDITNIVPASTTADNRRPIISACTINDEDCTTVNAALSSKKYSQRYLSSADTINYTLQANDIVALSTNNPYYNSFTSPNYGQTLMPANSVMTVWLYEIPVTSDAASQEIRHVFVQGQSITQATNSSAGALVIARNTEKLKTPLEVNLGVPAVVAAEYVCIHKFIVQYTGGNWSITDSIAITGSRSNQVGSPSGNYLTAVTTDTTLTGDGTVGTPLSIANPVTPQATGFTIAAGTTPKTLTVTDTASISGTNTGDQTGGTPAITLGTANTAGNATTFLRTNDTILAFDATALTAEAIGSTSSVGTATVAARRDHRHAMPTALAMLSGVGGGYAACATAIGTAAKTVALTGYTLVVGGTVGVTFTNGNSAAAPTLNINSAGAKPIFNNGVAAATIPAGFTCLLMYDGTNYNVIDDGLGATVPTTQAFGDTAVAGTSIEMAHVDHKHAMPAAPTATSVANTPAGRIAATTVQAAINELDGEKAYMTVNTAAPSSPQAGDLWWDTDDTTGITSGNADTVDNFNASATPTANTLLPLDANARLPLAGTARQNDTTNTVTAPRIETGWGVITINTTSTSYQEQITFQTAFSDKPIVIATFGGDNLTAGGATYGNGGSSIEAVVLVKAHTITNSSFYIHMAKPGLNAFGANGFAYYQWIAIGV